MIEIDRQRSDRFTHFLHAIDISFFINALHDYIVFYNAKFVKQGAQKSEIRLVTRKGNESDT